MTTRRRDFRKASAQDADTPRPAPNAQCRPLETGEDVTIEAADAIFPGQHFSPVPAVFEQVRKSRYEPIANRS